AGRILGGTLNPYKDYARELIPNDPASGPNPNHRMSQGRSPETQVFQVYLPPTLDRFDAVLLLEVNYGQSATRATRLSPIYYLPQFNRKEAYRIETALPGVSDGRRYGSNLTLSVLVEDWQQIAALDVNYPNASDTSGLRAPSSVVDVEVYAPGWNRTGVVETIAVGGLGTASSPLIYNMNVPRDAVLPPNPGASVPVLIKVDDQLDGTVISNTDPAFDLGHTRDVSAYKILEFQPTGSSQLLPASPQLLLHDTGLAIRPAPYAGSFEGTGGVEPFYTSGASTVFAGDHDDLRLLMAPASAANDLIAYDPLATESMSYAAGVRPYDDYPNSPQAHPNPAVPMPVFSLAATPGGNAIAGFGDDNFTINPLRFSTGLTDPVPNSAVTALWRWDGAVGTLGPRLSDGCGSAPGPSLGGKVRLALANDNNVTIGRWSNLLGWASAGMNSEACGTYARVDYYGTPYTSGA
ncbi:MAG TPA: hypothetical protein VEI97_21110, partial [bacterium]|nr:hypothetical protein [bacterium]